MWPLAPGVDGRLINLRAAPLQAGSQDHTTSLMDPSRKLAFVTALNIERRLLFGYLFKTDEFPWLQSWENYRDPTNIARGIEFSTQPFDVPRRQAIQLNSLLDAPTYRWLPAKKEIESRFLFFYTRVPDMTKVDDVRLEEGYIIVEDRAAGKRITLPASQPL